MKTRLISKLMLPALLLTVAGCEEPETPQTVLHLEKDVLEVTAAGGQYSVGYIVENPTSADIRPQAVAADDWVGGFTSDDMSITFDIEPNSEKEQRQTTITVTYEGYSGECVLTVTQDADGDFVLSTKNVDVPAEGGSFKVTYTLSGEAQDATVTASCPDSWISSIDCSAKGEISFTASPNGNTQERQATVVAKCASAGLEASFTVTQKGKGSASDSAFEIEIQKISPADVTYSVIPQDKEMSYMSMTISKSAFDKYGSEDEFFASELEFHKMMASAGGLSLEEYLGQKLMKGEQEYLKGEFLDPETEYYAYAYGMNTKGEKLTSITKTAFSTEALEYKDMTFEFKYTVEMTRVDVSVFPNLPEDWYFFSVMRTEGLGENPDMKVVIEDYLDYVIEYYMMTQGGSIEDALKLVAYRGIGLNSFDLVNDMEYVMFAAAIDMQTGCVVSDVTEERFMSLKADSDNKITLKTEYLGFTTAGISISVTNEDQYVFCIDKAENWEGMTEEQMLAKLTEKDMSYFTRSGNFLAPIQGREPGVEYRAFAFGYLSGIATTPLTTITFKMHDVAESDIELTVKFNKYFSIDELKKLHPEKFKDIPSDYNIIMPVWTSLRGSDTTDVKYYYSVYPGDWTTSSDIYSMVETILNEGCPLPKTNFYFLRDSYLQTHTFIGIAIDKNGNFGQLFRKAFNMTDDGISPAEDYPLDKFEQQAPAGKSFAYEATDTAFDISAADYTGTSKEDSPLSIGQYILSPDAARKIK